ncbi:hypothetical protein C8R46DRAFT_374101 [Mycena filopes]|nr:hypothetical protein C8R46DRAFT_374101 [Mycena filopes]
MVKSSSQLAQIRLIGATGLPSSRWGSRGSRVYVTVQVSGSPDHIKSLASPSSAAPVWHETLPPLSVTSSSVLTFQIHRLAMLPGFSRLISQAIVSMGELGKLNEDSSDDLIHLPTTPHGQGTGRPVLTFSLQVQDLSATVVANQIAPLAVGIQRGKPPTTATSETLSQIMIRLGAVSQFAVKFAQLHPVSAAAVAIVGGMAKSIELKLDSNTACAALMLDVHRVLRFVESAEVLPQIGAHVELISSILACVVDCVRHAYNQRGAGAFEILTSPSNEKDLKDLQRTLQDLETQMSQTLLVGLAHTSSRTEKGITSLVQDHELMKLRPLAMPWASSDSRRSPCFPGTRLEIITQLTTWAALTEESDPHVVWLAGPAGSGKSTIATTLANIFETPKPFFFQTPRRDFRPKDDVALCTSHWVDQRHSRYW